MATTRALHSRTRHPARAHGPAEIPESADLGSNPESVAVGGDGRLVTDAGADALLVVDHREGGVGTP